ncbi:hypothetical protein GOODEAATRI_026729 [Goodea atripinnis]|uniref:Uncharacterized protein n=1 Tax=Goodea atripinnis TaxID=208336 RepID=A0ABV0PHC5_9TELE
MVILRLHLNQPFITISNFKERGSAGVKKDSGCPAPGVALTTFFLFLTVFFLNGDRKICHFDGNGDGVDKRGEKRGTDAVEEEQTTDQPSVTMERARETRRLCRSTEFSGNNPT